MSQRHQDASRGSADARNPACSQAPAEPPEVVAEAVVMLARAERLTLIFRRLFWVAAAGFGVLAAVVICGNWEANPAWCLGMAGLGQAWMVGVALLALRVYDRAEKLERAAQAAATALNLSATRG